MHDTLRMIEFLTDALPFVNASTPTEVNCGGCGIFAQLLSDKLTEAGIDHTINVLVYGLPPQLEDDADAKREYSTCNKNLHELLNGNTEYLDKTGVDHIVICIDGTIYIDSTGIAMLAATQVASEINPISREQLDLLVEKGKWNPTFDRDCTDIMKYMLDEVFNKYDEYHAGMFKFPKNIEYTEHTKKWLRKQNPLGALADLFS